MEEQAMSTTVTEKLPYAPPEATFIPLKLEERLLECAKVMSGLQGSICGGLPQSS
jgi:hypothetical protein